MSGDENVEQLNFSAKDSDIFPGKETKRGIAISYVEARNRYGIDYHIVAEWVEDGLLESAGIYPRKHNPLPLVWSYDLEKLLDRLKYKPPDQSSRWANLVRREYFKRGLIPSEEALGEDLNLCRCRQPCCSSHRRRRDAGLYEEG